MVLLIKFFILIVFLAELVISCSIIFKIIKLCKYVSCLSDILQNNQTKTALFLVDIQFLFRDINENILKIKRLIDIKKQEYTIKAAKTFLIYSGIFFLRGKYKKTLLAYQIGKEIYAGLKDW